MTINLQEWLLKSQRQLAHVSDTPAVEARSIVCHVLGISQSFILAHPEHLLNEELLHKLDGFIEKRAAGQPLPYLLGQWEFYGVMFDVSPDVLIPRPETELLAEMAVLWGKNHPAALAIDVGTGSGCIGITLARLLPSIYVIASDVSPQALQIARGNSVRLGVEQRIGFLRMDVLSGIGCSIPLICANLPYIPRGDLANLDVARHEPLLALDGGSDGFQFIRRLLQQASQLLSFPGLLLAEIEYRQADLALSTAQEFFPDATSSIVEDLAGLPRCMRIERKSGDD